MLSEIKKELSGHPWQDKIQYFQTLGSTNTYAKELAAQGAAEGTVIVADQQTGGRGRLGRNFSSPAGMGIYFSIILRPNCYPEELMHLTCAAGVAASDAIAALGCQMPHIKWTNDLIWGKRKLGGILTEISVDSVSRKVDWAVVGIGINCCQENEDFPEDIRNIAISLGISPSLRPKLVAALVCNLWQMRQQLFSDKHGIMEQFRDRCITIGQEISVLRGDTVRHGTALHVDDEGGLLVAFCDGVSETVSSGEVSIRGMYGYL